MQATLKEGNPDYLCAHFENPTSSYCLSSLTYMRKVIDSKYVKSIYSCIYVHIVSMYLCIYVSMYLCIYVCMYLSIYLSIYLFHPHITHPSDDPSIHPSIHPSTNQISNIITWCITVSPQFSPRSSIHSHLVQWNDYKSVSASR